MQLTADTFLQIVQTLKADRGNGGRELRKAPRVGVRGRVSIAIPCKSGTRPISVNVRDLSAAGIGLLHSDPIPKGMEILLLLPQANDVAGRAVMCVVKRVQQLSPGLYSIGAMFLKEVKNDPNPLPIPAPNAMPIPTPSTPVVATPKPAARGPITSVSQPISDEVLEQADAAALAELDRRLRSLAV
jgi:hypothetical protein